jgi:hypothetical protein
MNGAAVRSRTPPVAQKPHRRLFRQKNNVFELRPFVDFP